MFCVPLTHFLGVKVPVPKIWKPSSCINLFHEFNFAETITRKLIVNNERSFILITAIPPGSTMIPDSPSRVGERKNSLATNTLCQCFSASIRQALTCAKLADSFSEGLDNFLRRAQIHGSTCKDSKNSIAY